MVTSWEASVLALETRKRAHVGMEDRDVPSSSLFLLVVAAGSPVTFDSGHMASPSGVLVNEALLKGKKRRLFVPFAVSAMADFKLSTYQLACNIPDNLTV